MFFEKIFEEMLFWYYCWFGERCLFEILEIFKDWILEIDYYVKVVVVIKGFKLSKKRFEGYLGMVK